MYRDFTATDRWTKKNVHCIYQALIVAIATRHADAVDIKFLIEGRTVWVALPLPAWVEYTNKTGAQITDALAIEIAGHYLKTALESGEGVGREMYSLTVDETLQHLDAVVAIVETPAAAADRLGHVSGLPNHPLGKTRLTLVDRNHLRSTAVRKEIELRECRRI